MDTSPLSDKTFANIFSHSVGCLLVLSTVSLAVQKIFILMTAQWFIFAFVSFAFGDIAEVLVKEVVACVLLLDFDQFLSHM